MKQVLQNLRSGDVRVQELPEPGSSEGWVLVAVECSLISPGTERALVGLGAQSLFGKARSRPDLVRKVVRTAREAGARAALAKVRSRLDRSLELGYSLAGRVLDTGGDPRLAPRQLVACAGAGYAVHADVVSVPRNLVVPVPPGVGVADAAFVAPAGIALHALRLGDAQVGSVVAVVGLGMIGQLSARLARAAGCIVVGYDPRDDRAAAISSLEGADAATTEEDARAFVSAASSGRGADVVLVCAATSSSGPTTLAAELARDRATVVVVGDVGLELDRRAFYAKELSLVVARSYGAGRYERSYEEQGIDLPSGYVRWTEQRNFDAVLELLRTRALHVDDLVTHRFPVEDAPRAYEAVRDGGSLGVLLEYTPAPDRTRLRHRAPVEHRPGALRIGLVGAGEFVRETLAPTLASLDGVQLSAVAARSGASAESLAARFGVERTTTDWRELIASDDIDAIVIATPHADHAEMAASALAAGKHVFVEKPLALTNAELREILDAAADAPGVLLVGHNRRFAPLLVRLKDAASAPLTAVYRVAAGSLPREHWLRDSGQGGRVLGEISHFVDVGAFLAGAAPISVYATPVPTGDESSMLATVGFEGGSALSLAYGVGDPGSLAKERLEVLWAGGAAVLDDFRRLELPGKTETAARDKGHAAQFAAFVAAARGVRPLSVSVEEQALVGAAAIALVESARTGLPVDVSLPS
jgi:predicted dehydrogenase